ncbi:SIMPL domain-containing protein [Polaribacter batillariae]|uniref:SIMPL domain-containing protein n=1 Tax=Polaribacter batillariae TaxID=2808900 RepID=A0ABX7T052_9FLAO|nr:SIMPL domain-containing protein [Polaribacter batillariae]QTD38641.1 SIMPL domain-containing protein [Polaribacter batillariae]
MKYYQLFVFFLLASVTYSQNFTQEKSFIEVVGTSEKEIIPDEIYLDIFLKERMQKGNKIKLERLENQLKQELKNIGIPENNLFISDINSVLSKTGWFSKEILSTAKYHLKVKNPKKLKQLFECFEALKITNVNITKATHSKIVALKKENRIEAIKAAKAKATYLLSAINEKVGKPIKINEIETHNPNFVAANHINVLGYGAGSGISKFRSNKSIVQFEKMVLKTSVYIKFEIK